jgi:hypothetical protein
LIPIVISELIVLPQDNIAEFAEDRATRDTTVVIEYVIFDSGVNCAGGRSKSQSATFPGCDSIFESGSIYDNCILFRFTIQMNDRASLHNLIVHCSSFSVIELEINT